jgi:hypothetical protein
MKWEANRRHLSQRQRVLITCAVLAWLLFVILWLATDAMILKAHAAPLKQTSATTQIAPAATICQHGVVTAFRSAPGGHIVYVVRTGHAFADAYFTTRHFWPTQLVIVCAGIVK